MTFRAQQHDDLLLLELDPPPIETVNPDTGETDQDWTPYLVEFRRGDNWIFGQRICTRTKRCRVWIRDFCAGVTQTFHARTLSEQDGFYAGTPRTISVTTTHPPSHTGTGTRDETTAGGGWAGTHSGTTTSGTSLVLDAGYATGTYTSPEIDLGADQLWRLGFQVEVSFADAARTASGLKVTAADLTFTAADDEAKVAASDMEPDARSLYALENDSIGDIYNTPGSWTLEVRTKTDGGAYGDWETGISEYRYCRYAQFRLTLNRDDTTDQTISIDTMTVSYSYQDAGSGSGATSLNELTDVTVSTYTSGQAMVGNGSGQYVPGTIGLGYGGTGGDLSSIDTLDLVRMNSGGTALESAGIAVSELATASALSAHTGDGTIHFTEASIDHTAISNIGSNSHATLDAHLAASAQVHGLAAGVSVAGTVGATTLNNLAAFDANGDLVDSGSSTSSFASASHHHDDRYYTETELITSGVLDARYYTESEIDTALGAYLEKDGTVALTANWDAGSYKITAQTFESDVTTGTAPLTVASTTLVSNLNADLLDGNEATAFATAGHNHTGTYLPLSGGTMVGNIAMGGYDITGVAVVNVDTVNERTPDAGVTIEGVTLKDSSFPNSVAFDSGLTTDSISEKTSDAGVTIDNFLIKDGGAYFRDDSTAKTVYLYAETTIDYILHLPEPDFEGENMALVQWSQDTDEIQLDGAELVGDILITGDLDVDGDLGVTGDLGINCTPAAPIDVTYPSNGDLLMIRKAPGSNVGLIKFERSGDDPRMTFFNATGAATLRFNATPGSDSYMMGSVGIGDSSPDGKLEVRQTAAADIFNLYDGANNVFTVIDGGNCGILTSSPSYALSVGSPTGADQVGIYHDDSNAYLKWTDGSLYLMSAEPTDHSSVVRVLGIGTGFGQVELYDQDNAESLTSYCYDGYGYLHTAGSSPQALLIQNSAHKDVRCFQGASEGRTPELKIYGYRTSDAKRSLEIGVGVDAADTASFDGLSNHLFDGNIECDDLDVNGQLDASAEPMLIYTYTGERTGVANKEFWIENNGGDIYGCYCDGVDSYKQQLAMV